MSKSIDELTQELASPDSATRTAAEDALVAHGAQAVDHVLPFLSEGQSAEVTLHAKAFLHRAREAVLPRLHDIRRNGPTDLRRPALRALVDIGGEEFLDMEDRHAIQRLVQIKLLDERPVSLPMETRWLAFPADRLDAAVSALGLHDLRTVTTITGVAAATVARDSMDFKSSAGSESTAYRVFITPEFSGWRFLFGNAFLDELGGTNLADKVSEQAGEAHFYAIDTYHNSQLWWISRDGHVVRGHSTYGEPEWVGDPLPFELEYMQGEDDPFADPYFVEKYAEGVTDADMAADALSVMPGPMPEPTTYGHGWLATTSTEAPNSRFKGVLPI
ncbi:hypothetical protein [Streptomyces sp. MBT33]|uniref:hypothetical protein n=1 Tax=Streptomyces sp. MBT33 TaxID=1488363 RepID=UPI00190CDDEE|nr:hypothetical protein [Streptomyces sp. MBT33]MBK3640026.1 hypothetical protein [Streptomyces sp. MBT33]